MSKANIPTQEQQIQDFLLNIRHHELANDSQQNLHKKTSKKFREDECNIYQELSQFYPGSEYKQSQSSKLKSASQSRKPRSKSQRRNSDERDLETP